MRDEENVPLRVISDENTKDNKKEGMFIFLTMKKPQITRYLVQSKHLKKAMRTYQEKSRLYKKTTFGRWVVGWTIFF